MDASKILTAICALILLVCLVFSITSLTALRNAVDESAALKESTDALVEELRACLANINTEQPDSDSLPTMGDSSAQTPPPTEAFCLKEANGKIGVFTSDGYLVRLLEVSVDSLPPADREALSVGITVGSWRELMSLIQDYTA
ncbi:MAG: hypothetical protein IKJ35_01165 [Clostridia bacterium]|nr:hypothetical protein [Clostridia bacterium]